MDEVERGMSLAGWAKATSRSPDDFDADIAEGEEKSEKRPPLAQPHQQETNR